ncbi:MAG: hypothetical protein ACE5J3_11280 [Methanosarcinales archaeon]
MCGTKLNFIKVSDAPLTSDAVTQKSAVGKVDGNGIGAINVTGNMHKSRQKGGL